MKQAHTINNEMIRYFSSINGEKDHEQSMVSSQLPGRHVIRNIMNYAKALDVMHDRKGQPFMLVSN